MQRVVSSFLCDVVIDLWNLLQTITFVLEYLKQIALFGTSYAGTDANEIIIIIIIISCKSMIHGIRTKTRVPFWISIWNVTILAAESFGILNIDSARLWKLLWYSLCLNCWSCCCCCWLFFEGFRDHLTIVLEHLCSTWIFLINWRRHYPKDMMLLS